VASVKIPVFGNGGIKNYQEARWMMEQTGCAGVLIGQAAVGNPLIFKEFLSESHSPSPRSDRFDLLKEHAQMITAYYGEETGLRRLRKFIASYVKELPHAAEFRNKALSLLKLEDLFRVIDDFRNSLQAI
jgi:tRNA-dihydrouridine synthase